MNAAGGNLPKWSEVFPFVVAIRPGFLGRLNWPVVAPTVFVALMSYYLVTTDQELFGIAGDQVTVDTNIGYYLDLLGAYILYIEFYFIYMLCGKRVSWLPCIGAAALVYVFMQSPLWDVAYGAFDKLGSLFDSSIISGPDTVDHSPFFLRFLGDTFSIGLREELVKALPAIALAVSYLYFNSARSDRFGVTEPLDGILICVAAAAAFSLNETFGQYIYQNNDQIAHFFQVNFPNSSIDLSNLAGLVDAKTNDDTERATLYIASLYVTANAFEVLIFRMFQDLCGHMAWTGIFGYFIGLFVLNPRRNWIALPVGWLIAAALHGFWDSSTSILASVVCALIAVLGLLAVIIKARQISPNRASNFASTTLTPAAAFAQPIPPAPFNPAPIHPVPVQPVQVPPVAAAPLPDPGFAGPPVPPPMLAPFKIDIGPLSIPLSVGTILNTDDIPGLEAPAGGKAAIVETNPKDGNMLGLRNLSLQSWEVEYADGRKIRLAPDKAMLIADAAKIDFGTAQGEILKVAL